MANRPTTVAVPYASLQGTATVVGQERDREISGLIDPRFHFSLNFLADATFYTGGQTRVDSRKNDDNLENSRAGATLALLVNRYNSIKLY